MQIETLQVNKPDDKPEDKPLGVTRVNTGDGKVKSTAAFGLALRRHGKAVTIFQIMNMPSAALNTKLG